MDLEDESEIKTDLNAHLGELQMGGGNDMLIDEYDPVDEKPDVAIITPEDSTKEPEPEVLATDCTWPQMSAPSQKLQANSLTDDAMKPRVLPLLPDLETESETVHTWEIEDWRNLPKKARGPIFECGGHPWYV